MTFVRACRRFACADDHGVRSAAAYRTAFDGANASGRLGEG